MAESSSLVSTPEEEPLTCQQILRNKIFVILVVAYCMLLDNVFYTMIMPILPLYKEKYQVSQSLLGVFTAAYPLAVCLFAPVVGWSIDSLGIKKTIIAGCITLEISTCLFTFVDYSFWMLLLARILQGMSASITWTSGMALVPIVCEKDEQGLYIGNLMVSAGVGGLAGPVVSGVLAGWLGPKAPFYLAVGLVALEILAVLLINPSEKPNSESKQGILTLLSDVGVIGVCLCNFSFGFMFALLEPIFPVYMASTYNMSTFWIGISIAGMMLSFTLASPLVGWLSDKFFPNRKVEALLFGVLGVAYSSPFLVVDVLWVVFLGIFFTGALSGLCTVANPIVNHIVDVRYDGKLYGAASAIATVVWNSGAILGPILGSLCADQFGAFYTFAAQFFFVVFVAIIPTMVILFTMREKISPRQIKVIKNEEQIQETTRLITPTKDE